jgi:hypothetical protein
MVWGFTTPGTNLSQIKELDGKMKLKMKIEHFGQKSIIENLLIMNYINYNHFSIPFSWKLNCSLQSGTGLAQTG